VTNRIDNWMKAAPDAFKALFSVSGYVAESGIEHATLELVKLRASQVNGCAQCIDMHTKDARAAGETEQRLYLLDAWREAAHLYTDRERAALALTEAATRLGEHHVPDDVYAAASACYSEAELVKLSLAIAVINAWNRMNITFRVKAGDYKPGMLKQVKLA
jgi:AhpD family alkylhydroperoxidase